jgi:hypothetical protein
VPRRAVLPRLAVQAGEEGGAESGGAGPMIGRARREAGRAAVEPALGEKDATGEAAPVPVGVGRGKISINRTPRARWEGREAEVRQGRGRRGWRGAIVGRPVASRRVVVGREEPAAESDFRGKEAAENAGEDGAGGGGGFNSGGEDAPGMDFQTLAERARRGGWEASNLRHETRRSLICAQVRRGREKYRRLVTVMLPKLFYGKR